MPKNKRALLMFKAIIDSVISPCKYPFDILNIELIKIQVNAAKIFHLSCFAKTYIFFNSLRVFFFGCSSVILLPLYIVFIQAINV